MKILQDRTRVAMLAATVAVGSSALSAPIFANEWQPASSESLMRMPVQHMDKSLDQSFRESTLFGEIDAAGTQIDIETQRMADLADAVLSGGERARLALAKMVPMAGPSMCRRVVMKMLWLLPGPASQVKVL